MKAWPTRPTIYEIHTWVWLENLSRIARRRITLGSVPSVAWDAIAAWGVDAVWLMGVWERSPAGRRIVRENPSLEAEYRRALPDYVPDDVVGSPWDDLVGRAWLLSDPLSGDAFARDGHQMHSPGLYVALEPWGFHFLKFEAMD